METPLLRSIVFVVMFAVLLVMPWWFSAPILIALTIYYRLYLEVLFFGFLFDTLYSGKFHFPYIGLVSGFILLVVVLFARTRVRT